MYPATRQACPRASPISLADDGEDPPDRHEDPAPHRERGQHEQDTRGPVQRGTDAHEDHPYKPCEPLGQQGEHPADGREDPGVEPLGRDDEQVPRQPGHDGVHPDPDGRKDQPDTLEQPADGSSDRGEQPHVHPVEQGHDTAGDPDDHGRDAREQQGEPGADPPGRPDDGMTQRGQDRAVQPHRGHDEQHLSEPASALPTGRTTYRHSATQGQTNSARATHPSARPSARPSGRSRVSRRNLPPTTSASHTIRTGTTRTSTTIRTGMRIATARHPSGCVPGLPADGFSRSIPA